MSAMHMNEEELQECDIDEFCDTDQYNLSKSRISDLDRGVNIEEHKHSQ